MRQHGRAQEDATERVPAAGGGWRQRAGSLRRAAGGIAGTVAWTIGCLDAWESHGTSVRVELKLDYLPKMFALLHAGMVKLGMSIYVSERF